jgi:hypothetical protein
LTQPRSENAFAPACTAVGVSNDAGGRSVACRLIEAWRILTSAHLTKPGSSCVPATL